MAIEAVLTPALRAEGLVRDLVRHVQTLRKEADYRLDERITVGLFALDAEMRAAVASFEDYFKGETLCETLLLEDADGDWDVRKELSLEGRRIALAVRR